VLVPPVLLPSRHTLRHRFSPPHPDFNFHTRPKAVENRDQATGGEAPEISIADTREVGRRDPGAAMSRAHAQAFPSERLDDFGSEDRLELLGTRVLVPEVAENIPASLRWLMYGVGRKTDCKRPCERNILDVCSG
jgi:hypothetical protein